ncbi:ECF transporter S component [Anaeroplasma bactoclasticum]|nr:ECF transporter S component [Anaeroplasma bactoclasticum]
MKNSLLIKKLVGLATLTALVVALQFLSNYVKFGEVEITLALIPIVVGAILYGPLAGGFLGLVMGAIVITAPGTQGLFMPVNPAATIILCLLKTGIAGLVAGLVFNLFSFIARKNENKKTKITLFGVGVVLATLLVPVINTGLFMVGAVLFFNSLPYFADFAVTWATVVTVNFAIEFTVSAVASPALVVLIKVLARNYNLGFAHNFDEFLEEEENSVLEEEIIASI